MADSVMTHKLVAKQVAQNHGVFVTFRPKTAFGVNGSGMHICAWYHSKVIELLIFDNNGCHHLNSFEIGLTMLASGNKSLPATFVRALDCC